MHGETKTQEESNYSLGTYAMRMDTQFLFTIFLIHSQACGLTKKEVLCRPIVFQAYNATRSLRRRISVTDLDESRIIKVFAPLVASCRMANHLSLHHDSKDSM